MTTVADIAAAWKRVGSWQETTRTENGQVDECPFCGGDGEVEGIIYDATAVHPATLVGYGIGQGLEDAELLAGAVPVLLAEVERLREALLKYRDGCQCQVLEDDVPCVFCASADVALADADVTP